MLGSTTPPTPDLPPPLTSVVQKHLVNLSIILASQLHVVGFICLAQVNAVETRVTAITPEKGRLFFEITDLFII